MRNLFYYIKEAIKSLYRNSLMSFASIITVMLSMFMLGVFLCGVVNLNNIASHLESQVQVSIYLKEGLTTPQVMALGKELKALPNLKHLEFINKVEAMERFKKRLGEDNQLIEALGNNNPLPSSYEVTLDNPQDVPKVAEWAATMPQVESTHYGKEIIENLFKLTQVIRIGGVVLMVFMAGATLFIISNTIRLTVFARRKEIAIMKLVGATNSFIRWPFLLEGVIIGAIGSAIAIVGLWQFYTFVLREASQSLTFLSLVGMYPFFYHLAAFIAAVGIAIGAIGSTISVKQYMKV